MKSCSDGHDEVHYAGRECPVCRLMDIVNDQEDKISEIEALNASLQAEYDGVVAEAQTAANLGWQED
jgi:hypothetical protein